MTNESIKWHPSSHPPQNFQLIRFDFATSFPPSLPAPSSHDILCDSQPIKRVLNYSIGSFSIQGFFSIARDYFQLLMAGGISSHRLCITSDQIDTSVLHQDSSPERKGRKGRKGGGERRSGIPSGWILHQQRPAVAGFIRVSDHHLMIRSDM